MTGALCLLPIVALSSPSGQPTVMVRLIEYYVRDASADLVAAYKQDRDGDAVLGLLRDVEPRLSATLELRHGEPGAVAEPRARGIVTVKPAAGGRFEVTLALERFFKGTPLLIDACRPFVVARSRATVQGRTQITIRAVEIDHGACRPGALVPPA